MSAEASGDIAMVVPRAAIELPKIGTYRTAAHCDQLVVGPNASVTFQRRRAGS